MHKTNTIIEAILNSIRLHKISEKDITTINYTEFPQYNFDNGKQTAREYTVTQDIQININPIDMTSKILDIITSNGAT